MDAARHVWDGTPTGTAPGQWGGIAVPAGGVQPEAEAGHGHSPHLLPPVRTQLPGTHLPLPHNSAGY